MPDPHPYYMIWTGALNLGDTPGVFTDAHFVGLLLQIPITVTFIPDDLVQAQFLLTTTEVEIFGNKPHRVFWDWSPGTAFPAPVGQIDDRDFVPGRPEIHPLSVPAASAGVGKHSVTIHVNSDVTAGPRDDFVLRRIEAHESIGVKFGW
jgi:hypothetical protein